MRDAWVEHTGRGIKGAVRLERRESKKEDERGGTVKEERGEKS